MSDDRVAIRLVFADRGSFHEIVVHLPAAQLDGYDRLIDALRENPDITGDIFVDSRRLVAAIREDAAERA
ncbi:MAG: hypothetical protein ACRELD_14220 [Longimicrobiales bacterium]